MRKNIIMDKKTIQPCLFDKKESLEINLPTSKSISNRVLILDALSYSPYGIKNLSDSDDTRVLEQVFDSNTNRFDVGAAGTSMRFLTAFLAKTMGEWEITGSERMMQRPIRILVDAINQLGGKITYLEKEGFPPLKILGCGLKGGKIEIDGNVSSQYISALMMIGPYMIEGLKLVLTNKITSKPYIEMTKSLMEEYGVEVYFEDNIIRIVPQNYQAIPYTVESDWSAASYWYEILAIQQSGKIQLNGLLANSVQGDRVVADIFTRFGIKTEFNKKGVEISYNPSTKGTTELFEYDFSDTPDLAQTVVLTACLLNIPFSFSGLHTLEIKETNRIEALCVELKKLGYLLRAEDDDKLLWNGEKCLAETNPCISTYKDHRMAMAFAPVGMMQKIQIDEPSVVSKSYPKFWHDFEKLYKIVN